LNEEESGLSYEIPEDSCPATIMHNGWSVGCILKIGHKEEDHLGDSGHGEADFTWREPKKGLVEAYG
jgi:hypothetical protein